MSELSDALSDALSDELSDALTDEISDALTDEISDDLINFFTTTIKVNKADMDILIQKLKNRNILSMDSLNSISNYGIKRLGLRAIPYRKLMITHGKEELKIRNNISCDCILCELEETSFTENSSTVKNFFKCTHFMCTIHFIAMSNLGSNILCPECRASQ